MSSSHHHSVLLFMEPKLNTVHLVAIITVPMITAHLDDF